ncbi:insulin-like growth factor-binding protein 1 [Brachionichthys hirsutus]|uniref:insulin-like growth factor-binding protein 1 n=1 Tax=Brachionichthys hirsutus TaxID=412623 RepID=UPI00360542B8
MPGLHEKLVLVAAVSILLVLVVVRTSPVVGPEPIRCGPCTQDKLNSCPAVPTDCQQVLREPGCGCCMACALKKGASCGIHTARCGEGLRCIPRAGEARPLHALTRGHGVCTDDLNQEKVEVADHDSLGLNIPAEHQDNAELNAIHKVLVQQGPCHTELQAALDRINNSQKKMGEGFTTFYLPNCDVHGFYKAKQCESSLVGPPTRCWCVSSWNGKKISETNDLLDDSECHQEGTR